MIMIQTRSYHQTFLLLLYVVHWGFNYVLAVKNPCSFNKKFYSPRCNEHFSFLVVGDIRIINNLLYVCRIKPNFMD